MTKTPPPLGTLGVVNTGDGFVPKAIRWFTATEDKYGTFRDSTVNHAVIFVGNVAGFDKPQLVQAQPGGADFANWDSYGGRIIWLPQLYQAGTGLPINLTAKQRAFIVAWAKSFATKRVGYNYLDFLAIALAQRRFGGVVSYDNPPWWVERLANPKHLICSQLDDYAYHLSGIQLFADKRLPGLVSPADILSLGESQ